MTEQEAIEILEKPSVHIKPVHKTENGMDFLSYSADLVEAFEMSIKALEKQIAKKPRYVDTRFRNHGRSIADGCSLDKCYECPTCRSHIFHVFDSEQYCKSCGQKLDWGNEDDIGKSN